MTPPTALLIAGAGGLVASAPGRMGPFISASLVACSAAASSSSTSAPPVTPRQGGGGAPPPVTVASALEEATVSLLYADEVHVVGYGCRAIARTCTLALHLHRAPE